MTYKIKVAGIERELPLCPIGDNLNIAAFILFGDVELTERCAAALYEKAPEHDVMITAESKGIPLVHAMCRLSGKNRYVLARKSVKLYMKDVVACETQSITTAAKQTLYISGDDAEYMKGKRVLIVDDVISTGGSLESLENLVTLAGGKIVGKMTILAEGDAIGRADITYLEKLPLFDGSGNPL
ncbi:MAG: adenine phosphoribosyltransferase [Ruminococcaceae bacterium]|nr:adenine phosphoribosyltransferase [Oscillospiraceae bacterium]